MNHLRLKNLVFLAVWMITFYSLPARAQVFGGNPASIKWKQINTDTLRVIFPDGLDTMAERVANLETYLNEHERKSIGNRERKLNIVLQDQTITSNGYVALAPFRSEFQITPPQESFELGSLNWVDFLSIHEYRHALQNMNFRKGFSKFMSLLFGQAGQSLASDMAIPNWFWEGDAVFMETALSPEGRGRFPSFFDPFRALQLNHIQYSWMKIRNGSLRDQVPDHYNLGYLMAAYGRLRFGDTLWKGVTNSAVRYRGLFYPFSHALKKATSMKVIPFYHAMLRYYSSHWIADTQRRFSYPVKPLDPTPEHRFVNHQYPVFISSDTLLYLRMTFRRVPSFWIQTPGGKQTRILNEDIVLQHYFSYNDHKIVWIGYRVDPRWGWKDYGILRLYDLYTHKLRTLSRKTRFFSPDISHNGRYIIVFQATVRQHYSLLLLDAGTGRLIRSLPNPGPYYYTYPKFSSDDKSIFSCVRVPDGRMALIQEWITGDRIKVLTPFSYKTMGVPFPANGGVFFSASYGRRDNIFFVSLKKNKVTQMSDELYGSYHPAYDPVRDALVFSEYSLKGDQLESINLKKDPGLALDTNAIQSPEDFYAGPALKEEGHNILDSIPSRPFGIKPYSRSFGLIHVHSWVPIFNDPDYGIRLQSDNILNTLSSSLFYSYNSNEFSHSIGVNALFGGWYPQMILGGEYTFNREYKDGTGNWVKWDESSAALGMELPLNLSANKYYRNLSLGLEAYEDGVHYLPGQKISLKDFTVNYFEGTFQFSQQLNSAQQNIFSHFGQDFLVRYDRTLNGRYAERWFLNGDLVFRGLGINHNMVLQGAFQQLDNQGQYYFPDEFVYARGYTEPYYTSIYRLGFNYQFPLLYPDWGFGGIAYVYRIRVNAFFDYSRTGWTLGNREGHQEFRSFGGELYFDTQWWNDYPLTLGIRYSRLLDQDPQVPSRKGYWELIIPIAFY